MISFVLADPIEEESISIKDRVRLLAAAFSEEHWDYSVLPGIKEYCKYIASKPLIHFCCFDYNLDEDNKHLIELRRDYDQMQLMIIADNT